MEPDEVTEKIGVVLGTSQELALNILKRLNYTDLKSATQVCQTWNKIGTTIMKRERNIKFMVSHPASLPNSDATTDDPLHMLDHNYPNIEHLNHFLDRQSQKRFVCLGFTNEEYIPKQFYREPNDIEQPVLYSTVKSRLPENCQLSIVSASGIIGTVEKSIIENPEGISSRAPMDLDCHDVGYSIEMEENDCKCDVYGFSFVTIPDQLGVKVKVINLNREEFFTKYRPDCSGSEDLQKLDITNEELSSMCQLDSSESIKALFIFYNDDDCLVPRAFEVAALTRQNNKLAMGGGLIRGLQNKDEKVDQNGTAIVFSGPNVTAASIVIPKTVFSRHQLRRHLQQFSDFYIPGRQTMCFMFTCCGRGQMWYTVKNKPFRDSNDSFRNVECKTFRELFPSVPIFGFFGEGELGIKYIPVDSTEPPNPKRRKQKSHHQFSTIFVMVSIL